ncbi:MAG: DNA cytosine methyltransferase [Candidatus Omnitrophica bacterium]|nr:DNA cytosine methyltransferase [Candidatus Omnitrophota bacterium]
MIRNKYNAIDLFAGCGGLSEGLKQAGFCTIAACEIDPVAVATYRLNHPSVTVFENDIKLVNTSEVKKLLGGEPLHLLAGCPPCQGFSSLRRLNKKRSVRDGRNSLVDEYYRFIEKLRPLTIMMENVPGLQNYFKFQNMIKKLERMGYRLDTAVVNVADYGVPQRRKRLIVVGSLLNEIKIAPSVNIKKTVAMCIGSIESIQETKDSLHKIVAKHTDKIMEMIRLIPKDGGSRTDLPKKYILKCHKRDNVGFNDIYGRLKWDDCSSTITGGCLNPSKGRFLHPSEHRAITAREAALLQTFPMNYEFPTNATKTKIALMIGNALPPEFCRLQAKNILDHLVVNYG